MKRFLFLVAIGLVCLLPLHSAFADTAVALENSDFSIGDGQIPAGWYSESWYDTDEDFHIETVKIDGQFCIHIINYNQNDSRVCQSVPVEGNAYYRISCDIKTQNITGGAGANVSAVDTLATSSPVTGSADWTHVDLQGKTEKGMKKLTVCMRVGGYGALSSGEAWFKNFSVTKLDSRPQGEVANFSIASAEGAEGDHNVNELHSGAIYLTAFLTVVIGMLCYNRYILPTENGIGSNKSDKKRGIIFLLIAAFFIRCILSVLFFGHSTDIVCFMAWSNALAEHGLASFYTSGMFADYPPGYMYVLWMTGSIAKLLGFSYGTTGYVLLTKMPGILADLAAAYLLYEMGKKHFSQQTALFLACTVALNPVVAFISGGWGQVDQILTLLLVGAMFLLTREKLIWAGVVYGFAILIKPQALMAGPLFMVVYFTKIFDAKKKLLAVAHTAAAVLAAAAVIFLASLPFKSDQSLFWVLDKYFGTATSYPYASIEAFNLFALFGGNWKPVGETFLIFTYQQWGTALIGLSCVIAAIFYLKSRKESWGLPLALSFLFAAVFTLGQYMHERYLFPVLLLLSISFIIAKDQRLFLSLLWFSCGMLINALAAFIVTGNTELRGTEYTVIERIGSAVNVLGFVYFTHVCYDLAIKKRRNPAFVEAPKDRGQECSVPELSIKSGKMTKRDRLICLVLTAVYAVVALVNLGSLQAPETAWKATVGQPAHIQFDGEHTVSKIWIYGGLNTGTLALTTDDQTEITYEQTNNAMFRWDSVPMEEFTASSVDLGVMSGSIWINEIAFFDEEGKLIPLSAQGEAACMTDEQNTIPDHASNMNGMYFDELYHARTAYEHLHGLSPYENSHPPLGKVFIMLGIALFGMNTFGWRIVGTLFGIGMIPILYVFAKRLFKRTDFALIASAVFAFDFMHYVQTRIATVDVYGVFFILLMYYFMYEYYCRNFYQEGLWSTLKPLAWAGVFFGLGAASKWICIYAGGGLAVILFTSLIQRYLEYKKDGNLNFWKNTLLTLLWCMLFFIVVPVAIYVASYLPYMLSVDKYDLKGIWEIQKFMYNYHSGLTATHPFESPWWKWPLDIRPVWYYVSYDVPEGMVSTISAFGNPAVWWTCSIGTIVLLTRLLAGKIKGDRGILVLLVGVAANYLPWVLVTRCTFAYHYFATVPFVILCTMYLWAEFERKHVDRAWMKWAWVGLVLLLFALFYPALSGVTCSKAYIQALEWLPSWTFVGY